MFLLERVVETGAWTRQQAASAAYCERQHYGESLGSGAFERYWNWKITRSAGEMIRHTPPEVIYHRISASATVAGDAACSSVVRKSMDGNGQAGSLSE